MSPHKKTPLASNSTFDLSGWTPDADELAAAEVLHGHIAQYVRDNPDRLKIYHGAIAIDGALTRDRDDAIKISRTATDVTVEVFIAAPTSFIKKDSLLDKLAMNRGTTLYMRNDNMPMLARSLSEDVLSLNAGKITPAIRVATTLDAKTGKRKRIEYEHCLVEADNMTYEQVGERIVRGDAKMKFWNEASKFLRSRRAKNSAGLVLPQYDEESGVLTNEDGRMLHVTPNVANAHNLVAEAMILANQSCAQLMSIYCPSATGVYRTQPRRGDYAVYTNKPNKHVSLGLDMYTHATSPNRRAVDMLVHRHLEALGRSFHVDFIDGQQPTAKRIAVKSPYTGDELREKLLHLNCHHVREQLWQGEVRRRINEDWQKAVFPETNPQELRKFDPVNFSLLLNGAAAANNMNDVFCKEVLDRIKHRGGDKGYYGLVFPKDAVNVFRFSGHHHDAHQTQWRKIRHALIEKLATDPEQVEQVFAQFLSKIEGKSVTPTEKLTTHSQPHPDDESKHEVFCARTLFTDSDNNTYAAPNFAIAFNEGPAVSRAKLEFMRAYAENELVKSGTAQLPDDSRTYIAKNLYRENSSRRLREITGAGYQVEETIRVTNQNLEGEIPALEAINREAQKKRKKHIYVPNGDEAGSDKKHLHKYTATVSQNGEQLLLITTKRDTAEDARRIGLEAAIAALRDKGHFADNAHAHSGLATFTGHLSEDGQHIEYKNKLLLTPKHARVSDIAAWVEIMDLLKEDFSVQTHDKGTALLIKPRIHTHAPRDLQGMGDLLLEAFPKAEVAVVKGKQLVLRNPPPDLISLVHERDRKR